MYRPTEIGSMINFAPDRAITKIRSALRKHGAIRGAAEQLGVNRTTLWRWIQKLDAEHAAGLANLLPRNVAAS